MVVTSANQCVITAHLSRGELRMEPWSGRPPGSLDPGLRPMASSVNTEETIPWMQSLQGAISHQEPGLDTFVSRQPGILIISAYVSHLSHLLLHFTLDAPVTSAQHGRRRCHDVPLTSLMISIYIDGHSAFTGSKVRHFIFIAFCVCFSKH